MIFLTIAHSAFPGGGIQSKKQEQVNMKIDLKNDQTVFKTASLMGPQSGPPSLVESSDGKITRIRPFSYEKYADWENLNPWKIEARGSTFEPPKHHPISPFYLAYKKRVYSKNRVTYPLKRVDWDPKGERNTQNRGKSRYVRISWDEAAQIIADELVRIRKKYGMSAVLCEADMHGEGKHVAPPHGCMNRLMSLMGGYTVQMRNMDSWEGWYWGAKNVWGCEPLGEMTPNANLWPDIAKNSDMLLFWAADPETTAMGFDGYVPVRLSQWIHRLGVKFVYIDPALNYSAAYQADKWIPILPTTDAALYLAIAYVWLTEGTYDREYVESHAVGYDGFFDYVLGRDGSEPKTPAWASEKCGVPTWTIKALARQWAKMTVSTTICNGGPGIRGPFSSEPGRLQPILLGMQGVGKPGVHQAKWTEWNLASKEYPMPYQGEGFIDLAHRAEYVRPYGAPNTVMATARGTEKRLDQIAKEKGDTELMKMHEERRKLTAPIPQAPQQGIPRCLIHDALLNGHVDWWGMYSFLGPAHEQWQHHVFPQPGCSTIHMIWTDSPCMVTCWNDGYSYVKAVRQPEIEFMVAQQPWLENDCVLADIILPVQTKFEMEDICEDPNGGIFSSVYHEYPACPPVGESLNDFDCVAEVAKKIDHDLYMAYTGDETSVQRVIELFWQGCGVAHLDVNDDFHKRDIFVLPANPHNQERPVGLEKFYKDPENNPLSTPTGKLEFTSTGILEHFPDDEERPPFPKWIEKSDMHDERLSSERAQKYPLLCMSNHGRWRFHANCDDITWNRENETMKIRGKDGYQYEAMWICPEEAEKRGIRHGDIVKIFNERGTVLAGAYVTERLMDRTIYVDHGSRFDPIDAEKLDRGGSINLITPHAITSKTATGMVVSGFLVQVEKVTDEEMEQWKRDYPESFARPRDPATGTCLESWMISGEEN